MVFFSCIMHTTVFISFYDIVYVYQQQGFEGGNVAREGGSRSRDRWGDIYANMPVKKMIALYDYDPQELSPNVDAEVSCVL